MRNFHVSLVADFQTLAADRDQLIKKITGLIRANELNERNFEVTVQDLGLVKKKVKKSK
jgi:hypothetical protein